MTTHSNGSVSWYHAVLTTASDQGVTLPPVASNAMGAVVWRTPRGDRSMTLKRRLLKRGSDASSAVVWGIWLTGDDVHPIILCPESSAPFQDRVSRFVAAAKAWLIDGVSVDDIRRIVGEPSSDHTMALKLPG